MDILIKSFNRPFYLDRCLTSIYTFVSGDFNIKILDDGTPKKYLDKIEARFPQIEILKSAAYEEKTEAIKENLKKGTEINGFQIPINLWIEAAQNASDYFIIIEDDVWFTKDVDLNQLSQDCLKFDIHLLKLGWLGNFGDDEYLHIKPLTDQIDATLPHKLFLSNEKVMNAFFKNHFKFYTLLYKLGLVDNRTREKYWALNSILMGLYKKEYWLEIWKGMNGKVDEKRQLINSSVFYKKNRKNPNFISRLKNEAMKTTFQSSATNSYHEYGYDFDVNLFNHLINEAWFKGDFDSSENFPNDFTLSYFEEFIGDKISVEEFRKWVAEFKNQYQNLGADVN
ncbi:glycosyltransferase family 2 protein [Kaistella polysaccharea]|uniref:glycosyltransferase family 2 protein n=1 Tax=Kaistella polysaccharea TaxID=2878534 RepID=UPI001CF4D61C|nr:glycosyltransferase family 2 protein [Kaistella polysaccharea]